MSKTTAAMAAVEKGNNMTINGKTSVRKQEKIAVAGLRRVVRSSGGDAR